MKYKLNHGHGVQIIGIGVIVLNGVTEWINPLLMWIYAGAIPLIYAWGYNNISQLREERKE